MKINFDKSFTQVRKYISTVDSSTGKIEEILDVVDGMEEHDKHFALMAAMGYSVVEECIETKADIAEMMEKIIAITVRALKEYPMHHETLKRKIREGE